MSTLATAVTKRFSFRSVIIIENHVSEDKKKFTEVKAREMKKSWVEIFELKNLVLKFENQIKSQKKSNSRFTKYLSTQKREATVNYNSVQVDKNNIERLFFLYRYYFWKVHFYIFEAFDVILTHSQKFQLCFRRKTFVFECY